jgi:hypothetical protein
MNLFGKAATGVALVSMFAVSVSVAAGQSAGQAAGGAANGGKCRVDVNRVADAGVFDVTRLVLDNGGCVCVVKTGPKNQGASTEASIGDLVRSRGCSDAPPAVREAAGASGGGNGGLLAVVGAGVAAGAAAAGAGGSDSPGN